MPDLSKSTAPTTPPPPPAPPGRRPPPAGPAVSPPLIHPEEFEEYSTFRETFLLLFTDARANAAMRSFGHVLYELVLEFWGYWPDHPEGMFPAELRAVAADLRHVQGCLTEWTGPAFSLEGHTEVRLASIGAEVAVTIGKLADRLETELDALRDGAH